jgi:hypothetical protein
MTSEEFEAAALNLQNCAEAVMVSSFTDPDASPWSEYLAVWADAGFITFLTINYLFYTRGYEELLNINSRPATRRRGFLTKLGLKAQTVTEFENWVMNLQSKAVAVAKGGTTNSRAGREYVHLSHQTNLVALLAQDYFWYKNSFEELLAATKEHLGAEQEILSKVKAITEKMVATTQKISDTLNSLGDELKNS